MLFTNTFALRCAVRRYTRMQEMMWDMRGNKGGDDEQAKQVG
jgi:hypothetical protein